MERAGKVVGCTSLIWEYDGPTVQKKKEKAGTTLLIQHYAMMK